MNYESTIKRLKKMESSSHVADFSTLAFSTFNWKIDELNLAYEK